MFKTAFNFIGFQLVWISCVVGASQALIWPGVLITVLFIGMHFYVSECRQSDLILMMLGGLCGLVLDSILMHADLLVFTGHDSFFIPIWLVCLWLGFSLTINHSLSWIKRQYYIALIVGALGGPLSYFAGARLGAVDLPDVFKAMLFLGAIWAFVTPLLVLVSNHKILKFVEE